MMSLILFNKLGVCALALCWLLALAIPANSKVVITERTKYYKVTGKTGAQMFRSITRRGPKTRRDGHAIATTKTSIRVRNFKTAIKGRNCVLKNVNVILKLTYTLPRWRGSRSASTKTRKNWDKFLALVKKHEATHGRISREYARKLHTRLKRLTGNVSRGCKDFGKFHKRSLRLAEEEFTRRHRAFDRREGRANSRIRRLQKALLGSR